jgi:hypothetical protein
LDHHRAPSLLSIVVLCSLNTGASDGVAVTAPHDRSERLEPLCSGSLGALTRRAVVLPVGHFVRQISLLDDTAREVMRVSVAAAML